MRPAPDDPELVGRPASLAELPLFAPEAPADPRRAACESMADRNPRLRAAVLDAVRKKGQLTADEIADAIGATVLATRPRVTELQQEGLLYDTGLRRPNSSGRQATVWGAR